MADSSRVESCRVVYRVVSKEKKTSIVFSRSKKKVKKGITVENRFYTTWILYTRKTRSAPHDPLFGPRYFTPLDILSSRFVMLLCQYVSVSPLGRFQALLSVVVFS